MGPGDENFVTQSPDISIWEEMRRGDEIELLEQHGRLPKGTTVTIAKIGKDTVYYAEEGGKMRRVPKSKLETCESLLKKYLWEGKIVKGPANKDCNPTGFSWADENLFFGENLRFFKTKEEWAEARERLKARNTIRSRNGGAKKRPCGKFQIGLKVRLQGLKQSGKPFNGQTVTLESFDEKYGAWRVTGKKGSFLEKNMVLSDSA